MVSDSFTSVQVSGLPVCVVLDHWLDARRVEIRTGQQRIALSQDNTTVESQTSLVDHKKIPKLKTNLFARSSAKFST